MATTVTATTLTSTITESISLNGNTYGNTISHSVATVGECLSSTMSVALTEVTVLTLGTVDAGGTVVGDNVKYMRFTNLDDTNFIS